MNIKYGVLSIATALILTGCASNPMRNTPGFIKPNWSQLKTNGAYGINYRYPNLTSTKAVEKQIKKFNKTNPVDKSLNTFDDAKNYVTAQYKNAPVLPQQLLSKVANLQKNHKITTKQAENYKNAIYNIKPDVNQLGLAALKVDHQLKNKYLTAKNLQTVKNQLATTAKMTGDEVEKLLKQ